MLGIVLAVDSSDPLSSDPLSLNCTLVLYLYLVTLQLVPSREFEANGVCATSLLRRATVPNKLMGVIHMGKCA